MISKRIKQVRLGLMLNQGEFASKIDLSQSHIAALESNKRIPTEKTCEKIAETFNIDYNWLMNGSGSMYADKQGEILLNKWNSSFAKLLEQYKKSLAILSNINLELSNEINSSHEIFEICISKLDIYILHYQSINDIIDGLDGLNESSKLLSEENQNMFLEMQRLSLEIKAKFNDNAFNFIKLIKDYYSHKIGELMQSLEGKDKNKSFEIRILALFDQLTDENKLVAIGRIDEMLLNQDKELKGTKKVEK